MLIYPKFHSKSFNYLYKHPLLDSQSDREITFSYAILLYITVVLKPLEVIKYFYFIVAMGPYLQKDIALLERI